MARKIIEGEVLSPPLNDNFTELYNDVNSFKGTNTNLQTQITANTNNINGLRQDVTIQQSKTTSLQNQINSISTADSNATIGVYSTEDSTNTNNYTATITGLSYFGGLKINLTVSNFNTSTATLNLNGLGAKNIKIKTKSGTKVDLSGGEIYGIVQLEYDETDFILINGEVAEETPEIYNDSSIFSAGVGTDVNGNALDYSDSVVNGRVNIESINGNTRTNISTIYIKSLTSGVVSVTTVELQAGKEYTLSSYVDCSASADGARIRIKDATPSFFVGNTISAGQKGYSVVTFTPSLSGTHTIEAQKMSANDLNVIEFTEILLEETDTRKPFIIGTKSTVSLRLRSVNSDETEDSISYILLKSSDGNDEELVSVVDNLGNIVSQDKVDTDGNLIKETNKALNVASGTTINYADMSTGQWFNAYNNTTGEQQIGQKGDTLTITAEILYYELSSPNTIKLDMTPLYAYENGTIYIEPFLRKSIKYNTTTGNGLDFPIALLDIEKIEDIQGNEIDLSSITLDASGDFATITGATDGEVYTVYGNIRPELSTIPTTIFKYVMNSKGQIESNNKAIQTHSSNIISLQDQVDALILQSIV